MSTQPDLRRGRLRTLFAVSTMALTLALGLLVATPAPAADTFLDTWNDGDPACWLGDSAWTDVLVVWNEGPGGNALHSFSTDGPTFFAGIQTFKPAAAGNWVRAQASSLSVKARRVNGTPTGAGFRVRSSPSAGGWFYVVQADGIDTAWTPLSAPIDANWTDEEAVAAGWLSEGGNTPTWEDTLRDHYQLSFRAMTNAGPLEMAYDDFEVIFDGPACSGDTNNDGAVDVNDLLGVLAHWNNCNCCLQDITRDGNVDVSDVLEVLAQWGSCD